MIGLPLFDDPAPPAVRRPRVELAFGASPPSAWAEHLVSLRAVSALAPAVDVVELSVRADAAASDAGGPGGPAGDVAGAAGSLASAAGDLLGGDTGAPPTVALDDAGTVSLGYADLPPVAVFAGRVSAFAHRPGSALRVTATGGAADLARARPIRSWEQQTAGAVVRDLASDAGVATGTVDDGIDLAFFAADGRDSAWHVISDLAARGGLAARIDPDGKLDVRAIQTGDPVQTFHYGDDVLDLSVRERAPAPGRSVVGEGAAGSAGRDAWSWLVKDPASMTAAAGDEPLRVHADGALRSADAVAKAATAIGERIGRAGIAGRLLVAGAPAVAAGATFTIADAPGEAMNGEMLAVRVEHRFSDTSGFVTRIDFQRAAAPASAGGLLGLAGGLL